MRLQMQLGLIGVRTKETGTGLSTRLMSFFEITAFLGKATAREVRVEWY